jgi:hypothetical protein
VTTKWITLPITLQAIDPASSIPIVNDASGVQLQGREVLISYSPGTPIELDAAKADRLLARFAEAGAVEVDPPEASSAPSVSQTNVPAGSNIASVAAPSAPAAPSADQASAPSA